MLAKRGAFCGVVGPRLSVNRNLEKVFREYIEQVQQEETENLEKEKKKHGECLIPPKKPFQGGDEGVFNLKDGEETVRKDVFQEVVNNLIKQDNRFGNFEKKILYLDCNNLYGN